MPRFSGRPAACTRAISAQPIGNDLRELHGSPHAAPSRRTGPGGSDAWGVSPAPSLPRTARAVVGQRPLRRREGRVGGLGAVVAQVDLVQSLVRLRAPRGVGERALEVWQRTFDE